MNIRKFLLISAELRTAIILRVVLLKVLSKGIYLKVINIATFLNDQLAGLEETFWTKLTIAFKMTESAWAILLPSLPKPPRFQSSIIVLFHYVRNLNSCCNDFEVVHNNDSNIHDKDKVLP